EFYMLHPAFETLFYFLKTVSVGKTPEDKYDIHIERFIKAINKYGTETPELEILGETLRRLWYESKQLTAQSFTDSLTSLLNRRGLTHSINILARLSERNKYTVGVMMIDIDHFKQINDTHGHQKGDEVLKKVAGIIKGKIRASDIVGRYGGEEILVFLPEVKSEALTDTAEKIRSGVEKGTEEDIPVTISIGCTKGLIRGDVEKELAGLIKTADECMYKAKEAGRNRVVVCN
ncbi:MAG: GGDEF domain-containing protein, partial [Candidatus Mariimomonas ferrooxydans]